MHRARIDLESLSRGKQAIRRLFPSGDIARGVFREQIPLFVELRNQIEMPHDRNSLFIGERADFLEIEFGKF